MSRNNRRPRIEIARGVRRLQQEELKSIYELAAEACVTPRVLQRWIIEGKPGTTGRVHLDGLHRPQVGWMSSPQAVQRFRDQLATQEPSAA